MNVQILQFLSELKENNYREWFQENKERYETLKAGFLEELQQLINRIALFDPEITGLEAKNCLFRIYRDIRFSPDKTPYKTHFAAYIAQGGRSSERAGYYIHLEPGNCLLSGGIWMPPTPLLKKLRQEIYSQIDEFMEILKEPSFKKTFPELEGEVLKRNPTGFPESPHDHIIRHKDFSVVSGKSDSFFTKECWLEKSTEDFQKLFSFNKFLNYIVDEYWGRI
ncbi:MAG: DUF2461 domain-containing protein [Massilibacteroides sp.]|nr:DUF2461 domain-containing protein [Massilibacteroides sp.]MDD3063233.1 DUF2461 domain-containing protein [Massilibacteroides sp.]MDD4115624.1 DUF2461 domain-containing protein [Massilibacteroides sp.]MDD4661159.1 DUF2461 domain-containing protein [Massilibacteroides sp.]